MFSEHISIIFCNFYIWKFWWTFYKYFIIEYKLSSFIFELRILVISYAMQYTECYSFIICFVIFQQILWCSTRIHGKNMEPWKWAQCFKTLGICSLISSCDRENGVIVELTIFADRMSGGKWKLYPLNVQYSSYIKSMLLSTCNWSLYLMSRHHRKIIEKKFHHRGFCIEEEDLCMWLCVHL